MTPAPTGLLGLGIWELVVIGLGIMALVAVAVGILLLAVSRQRKKRG